MCSEQIVSQLESTWASEILTHIARTHGYRIDPYLDVITLKTRWTWTNSGPLRGVNVEKLMELVQLYFLASDYD